MGSATPVIFSIQRFALDDGPGIRTTVYIKGCPLSCIWCHNPESMRAAPEAVFNSDKCINCGSCASICPETDATGLPVIRYDRCLCAVCGGCADMCPATAIRVVGKEYPLDELLKIVLRDRCLFDTSGGGVTFSGGEPTLAMKYLSNALKRFKSENIHTVIQTCGLFDYDEFCQKVLPFTDLIMFDIKFISAASHRKYTGQDNSAILENLRRLTQDAAGKVLPRVPLVPGITATPDNMREIAIFLADLGCERCDLLPYNPAGVEKRRAMGMKIPQGLPDSGLSAAEEEQLRCYFEKLD